MAKAPSAKTSGDPFHQRNVQRIIGMALGTFSTVLFFTWAVGPYDHSDWMTFWIVFLYIVPFLVGLCFFVVSLSEADEVIDCKNWKKKDSRSRCWRALSPYVTPYASAALSSIVVAVSHVFKWPSTLELFLVAGAATLVVTLGEKVSASATGTGNRLNGDIWTS